MTHRVATLLVAVTISLFSLLGCSANPDPDGLVLSQLKDAGSDLSKPHRIEFFLYFPTQTIAEQAAMRIRDQGFVVEVKPPTQGNNEWLCFATKMMVPDLSALQQIRRDFNAIATSLNGQYDGWGTPVQR